MPRRFEISTHARFLTFSCYRKKLLFKSDHLAKMFIELLDTWRRDQDIKLWAFVVMHDHVHLLLFPGDKDLGKAISRLKQSFGYYALSWLKEHRDITYNELRVNVKGVWKHRFWQAGGGYDRNIFNEQKLVETMTYIHQNPVRKNLVKYEENYPWSSALFWKLKKPIPLEIDIPEWWK